MNDVLAQKIRSIYTSRTLLWIIISIGIALRISRYLYNPSLYFDEANTAIDIFSRSFSELLQASPDYDQVYPFSFLMLSKLAVNAFGNNEYAFRLLPLFFGIVSVVLFCHIAKYFLGPEAAPPALFFFAILDPLVYYSSIIKPYAGDLAFALIILALTVYIQSHKMNLPRTFLFGSGGAIILWFSNPSIFILAGVGLSLTIFCVSGRKWPELKMLFVVFFIWAISFVAFYFAYLDDAMMNVTMGIEEVLKKENAFMPLPPKSMSEIKWYLDMLFNTFNFHDEFDLGGQKLNLTGIVAFAFLFGCVSIYSRKKEHFLILIAPILFTLAASAMHKYPFKGRLILFLAPFIILFIGEGIKQIWMKMKNNSALIGIIFIILLFVYPVSWAAYHVKKPFSHSEIKPVLSYMKNNRQEGDIIYVHYFAQYEFEYYAEFYEKAYDFTGNEIITGIAPRGWYDRWKKQDISKYYDDKKPVIQARSDILNQYIRDLNQLRGHNRVWILFSGQARQGSMKEEDFYLYYLDSIGKKLDTFGKSATTVAYLYDLSGKEPTSD